VLLDEPTYPGCLISRRLIGMFRMRDEKGADDKRFAEAAGPSETGAHGGPEPG
jgi:inorganic pyrophosphatase